MEHEEIVLGDCEFESFLDQPGYYTGYPGTLMRVEAGVSWTIYQKSHWDKRQAILRIVRARKDWDCASEIRERMGKGALLDGREDRLFGLHPGWTGTLLTVQEVEAYAEAEERVLDCQQCHRDMIKVGGARLNLWAKDDAACAEYLRAFDILERDDMHGPFMRNRVLTYDDVKKAEAIVMPEYRHIVGALYPDEIQLLLDLAKRIEEARETQLELFGMASVRWADANPEAARREQWESRHPDEPLINYRPEGAEE